VARRTEGATVLTERKWGRTRWGEEEGNWGSAFKGKRRRQFLGRGVASGAVGTQKSEGNRRSWAGTAVAEGDDSLRKKELTGGVRSSVRKGRNRWWAVAGLARAGCGSRYWAKNREKGRELRPRKEKD
jgi:hypothetical protein